MALSPVIPATTVPATTVATGRKPINPWLIFILICVPIFIGSVDLTAIVVVLPQATLDLLGPKGLDKADQALWAVTAYLLAYTLSLALVGRLSDAVSRKKVFLVCNGIFVLGALWTGVTTGLPLTLLKMLPIWPDPDVLPLISLVIGRIIQAIGAGAAVSVGMAMVGDIFPPEQRAEPISLIGALDSLGWVVGNLFAGVMLQILSSWESFFIIQAVIAVAALGLTVVALRHVELGKGSGRYDWRGALIFSAALIALTVGIEALKDPSFTAYALMVVSMAFVIVFIVLQLRSRNALFDMTFIRKPEVRDALLTNVLIGFGLILMVAGVPLIINLRAVFLRGEGLLTGALRAGVTLSALTIPLIVAVLIGESRYRKIGVGIPVSAGLIIGAVGFITAGLWTYTAPGWVIAIPLALVGVGLGLTMGPLSLIVVDAAEPSSRGLASSLVLTARLLGMTFGTPLAASLTLKLANDWADARVADMGALRDIARSMLIPPMATDALAHVMIAGVAACLIGLVAFYGRSALRRLRTGIKLHSVLRGSPTLIMVVGIVGGVAVYDSYNTPTILANPIAQQLPPNVIFYAAVNLQQLFLLNTRRPIDAVTQVAGQLAPQIAPAAAAQPAEDSMATVIKSLFRARQWTPESYRAFCPLPIPSQDQWQACFINGLLSWVGPQAAFALLPRTQADDDYLFAFQATNRNNAVAFATQLADALGEQEPVETGPNIRVLTINDGQPDEQKVAITEAYVLVGTPRAIEYTLNHGELSLANQPEYKAITGQLPPADFATMFLRSSNFQADLMPVLDKLFHSALIDVVSQIAQQVSPLAFTRNSSSPTLMGMSLRVDESHVNVDMVANFPFSLQKLNALPVSSSLMSLIPDKAQFWAESNLNIAGLAREVSIPQVLQLFANNGNTQVRTLLNNPVAQTVLSGFGTSLQTVLTYATGNMMVVGLPGDSTHAPSGAVILPLSDKENTTAASAVNALKNQVTLLGVLTGALSVNTQPGTAGSSPVVTISGSSLQPVLPNGFQYTLTSDNMLIIAAGDALSRLLPSQNGTAAANEIHSLPSPQNGFLYAYVDPAQNFALTALMGVQIKRQQLTMNVVLQTR